jgi:hypothetical protein
MLRKRKEPKRKSIALTLMRDLQGTAGEKLGHVEKLKACGEFAGTDGVELLKMERMLRGFAAIEKGSVS